MSNKDSSLFLRSVGRLVYYCPLSIDKGAKVKVHMMFLREKQMHHSLKKKSILFCCWFLWKWYDFRVHEKVFHLFRNMSKKIVFRLIFESFLPLSGFFWDQIYSWNVKIHHTWHLWCVVFSLPNAVKKRSPFHRYFVLLLELYFRTFFTLCWSSLDPPSEATINKLIPCQLASPSNIWWQLCPVKVFLTWVNIPSPFNHSFNDIFYFSTVFLLE